MIAVVAILAVLLVVADRVGVVVAQNVAASQLRENAQFAGQPSINVRGVPFLTQALRGRYNDIQVSGRLSSLGQIRGAGLNVDLRGAHLPLSDLLRHDVNNVPVDQVQGTVVIPYSELARLSKIPNLTITPNGSRLDASARIDLPVIGGTVDVTGEGKLALVDGKIQVTITELRAGGVTVPSAVLPAVSAAVTGLIPLPELPYGLHLQSITPSSDGLDVAGAGTNVVLRRVS